MGRAETGIRLISMRRGAGRMDPLREGREEIGGKAQGLLSVRQAIAGIGSEHNVDAEFTVDIPRMAVLGTSVFEAFIERNRLLEVALSDLPDERIAHAFQRADLPFEVLGDLRDLANRWTIPLAVRSSGWLEDATQRPFAGVYQTKMVPNHWHNPDTRFQKLVEAVKLVWASTFFKISKDYCKATGLCMENEKMAVILQEMVGKRHHSRFYPELSGVARSFNYYPVRPARPEDGVVSLALGLGKTIVDGAKCWTYSPAYPHRPPPFKSPQETLDETQNEFWVVNLGEPPEYNPIKETEYMQKADLLAAEQDGVLDYLASTFDVESERLSAGTGARGPRVLTFAPLLELDEFRFNRLVSDVLMGCEQALDGPVEIEFAATFDPFRFGFLQVRPMVVPSGSLQVTPEDLRRPGVVAASEMVLGNGILEDIQDIVYVIPERFDLKDTRQIAEELDQHNHRLVEENRPYLLIVFGRLGSLDPWLGIPVTWGQICGAKVVVEATRENVRVELSQGSHYFHNITNLGVIYFSMPFTHPHRVDWDWLERQPVFDEKPFTRHVRLPAPLKIKVDGRSGRGVIGER
jgi:hypothetical protein